MANTRNSQKRENDDTPAAADSKDSDNADVPVTTLDTLLQELRAQKTDLQSEIRSQGEATKTDLQSEMRSLRSVFDERLDKIESTSEQHEEALHSFSTRLNRIETQLAEQNMQHDNNPNINGSNVNNSNQNGNNNQNDFLIPSGGLPARIRFRQNLDPIEDLSVSHAQGQPPQPHATPQPSQPVPRQHSEVVEVLQMKAIKRVVEDESRGKSLQDDPTVSTSKKAECIGLDLTGNVTYIRADYVKVQGGTAYEIPGDDIPPDKANALKLKLKIPPDKANAFKLTPDNYRQIQRQKKLNNWQRKRH